MATRSISAKNNMDKKVKSFLKDNPEIEKTMKVFNMNFKEYSDAINSSIPQSPITNFKNTQWQTGNK